MTTTQIERCITNLLAGVGGVPTPFLYTVRWLWTETGPVAHVLVQKAAENVLPTPNRFVGKKKGKSKP